MRLAPSMLTVVLLSVRLFTYLETGAITLRMLLQNRPALILASSSPRRQELLREAGIPFGVEELASLGLDLDTPADVIAQTSLYKIGKRLAVGDVLMYSAGESVPCARASVTYAIPSVRLDPPVE